MQEMIENIEKEINTLTTQVIIIERQRDFLCDLLDRLKKIQSFEGVKK